MIILANGHNEKTNQTQHIQRERETDDHSFDEPNTDHFFLIYP